MMDRRFASWFCGSLPRLVLLAALALPLLLSAHRAGAQAPPTPAGVAATPGNQSITVSWSASTGATSYNLYRSTSPGGEGTTAYQTGITTLSWADTGLNNGSRYYYKVSAVNTSGQSAPSAEVSTTAGMPSTPTGLTASAGNNQVTLAWSASSGAVVTYNIYIGLSPGGEGTTPSVTGVKPPGWGHYGATNGTTYYYKVTAKNLWGESPQSAEVSGTPAIGVPAPPAQLVLTPNNNQVQISWQSDATAASYNVKRATASAGPYTTLLSPVTPGATDNGVTNGTTYYYEVTAVNSYGESAPAGPQSVVPNPPPPAPTNLAAGKGTPSTTSINLTWTASTGASSYNTYRSADGDSFSLVGYSTSPAYTDINLSAGTQYWYEVTAVGPTGVESGVSNEITFFTDSTLSGASCGSPPPSGYQYVNNYTSQMPAITNPWLTEISIPPLVRVKWNYSSPVCSYHFTWSRSGGSTASGTTPVASLADPFAFVPGTSYTYTLIAVADSVVWTTTVVNGITWYNGTTYSNSAPVSLTFTPQQVTVSDNQAIDARYDLRYGNPTYLNFQFGSRTYNGGLYVGNSTDPSRTGRSLLRFIPPTAGTGVWSADIDAYVEGASTNVTNASVGLQGITDNGWASSSVSWATAPSFTASAASSAVSVSYNPSNPSTFWVRWPIDNTLWSQLENNSALCAGIATTTELADQQNSVNNWLYLCKKEYKASTGAILTYATGAPLGLVRVSASPASVKGGTSASGTVQLNGPAPTGGAVVTLSSDNSYASVPANVTVPAGAASASFTITTTATTTSTTANIGGTYQSPTLTAALVVTP